MRLIGWKASSGGWDEAPGMSLKTLTQEAAVCQQANVADRVRRRNPIMNHTK